jgi:hypothetical protein
MKTNRSATGSSDLLNAATMTRASNDRKPGRNIYIDALRGLMLVTMTIHHFPSLFDNYTFESLGYVQAAEGFVFLSGLVAGRVYARYNAAESGTLLWKRTLTRAGFIYSVHLLTFFTFFSLSVLFSVRTWGLETWTSRFYEHPVPALLMGITLLYQPQFLDILPMYAVFILTVPLAVQLAEKNRLRLILFFSAAVWSLAQFGLGNCVYTALAKVCPVYLGMFDIFAWQFLFVLGVCIGIRGTTGYIPSRFRPLILIVCIAVAAFLFCTRYGFISHEVRFKVESLSVKLTLGPIRLVNFAAFAFIVQSGLPWLTKNLFVEGLAVLGRHSLEVFTFHILLLYFFFGLFNTSGSKEWWDLLLVGSLFLPACLLEKYPNPWKTCFYRLVSGNKWS